MNPLTIAELRLHQADLAHKAEKLRQEQRSTPAISARASFLGKQVQAFQERANDYAEILRKLEQT